MSMPCPTPTQANKTATCKLVQRGPDPRGLRILHRTDGREKLISLQVIRHRQAQVVTLCNDSCSVCNHSSNRASTNRVAKPTRATTRVASGLLCHLPAVDTGFASTGWASHQSKWPDSSNTHNLASSLSPLDTATWARRWLQGTLGFRIQKLNKPYPALAHSRPLQPTHILFLSLKTADSTRTCIYPSHILSQGIP